MKKIFTLLATSLLVISASAQTVFSATYDFAEAPGTDNGDITGSGFTVTPFSATGLTSTTTTNRFAWSGTTTASAPDAGKYFQVTVTPSAGNTVSISSITFRSQRSGTGPRKYVVRASTDSYTANLPASISPANAELIVQGANEFYFVNDISTGQNGNVVTPSSLNNISSAVTLRFYFYNAEAESGTFSVDDVVISGTITTGALAVSDLNKKNKNFIKNTLVKNEEITFGTDVKDIKIYSLTGQVMKSASVKDGTTLNVADLAKGNYIVTGSVNNQQVSQKILKD